jgi:endonuclease/exonuclease/phosphatase family metal-dependent hydrolase
MSRVGHGCNYRAFVPLASPIGTINIERGFVAVDAQARNAMVRFVNTHLEIPELPVAIQAAQAAELIATLGTQPNYQRLPVIVVGDINSAPTDKGVVVNGQKIVPPYRQLARAGYMDAWELKRGDAPGLTCCQAADLLNTESMLLKRVDIVWTDVRPQSVRASRVGANPDDRLPSGLWPSDHAGVVARLQFGW